MRQILATIGALITIGVATSNAAACETYTFGNDQFGLDRGVQWAFLGTVVREEPNAELPNRPNAVVIRVERTVAGRSAGRELRIRQDAGCDGFWYRRGDRVVAAIPFYLGFLEPAPAFRLRPPFPDLTNYAVAVWVLDGDRIVPGPGPHSDPSIHGHVPRTLDELLSALTGLPETATEGPPPAPPAPADITGELLAGAAGAAGAALMLRRLDRRPPPARPAA